MTTATFRCPRCNGGFEQLGVRDDHYCCPLCDARLAERTPKGRSRRSGYHRRKLRPYLIALHGSVCHLCGERIEEDPIDLDMAFSIDHVIPLSEGGSWRRENLRPAHRWCNSRRGSRPLWVGNDIEEAA